MINGIFSSSLLWYCRSLIDLRPAARRLTALRPHLIAPKIQGAFLSKYILQPAVLTNILQSHPGNATVVPCYDCPHDGILEHEWNRLYKRLEHILYYSCSCLSAPALVWALCWHACQPYLGTLRWHARPPRIFNEQTIAIWKSAVYCPSLRGYSTCLTVIEFGLNAKYKLPCTLVHSLSF